MARPHPLPDLRALTLGVLLLLGATAQAEGPPRMTNGAIGSAALQANKDVANAQGVGAVSRFINQGTQKCDANGANCRSLMGSDDQIDYTSAQSMSQSLTGISSAQLATGEGSANLTTQTGSLAFACGDSKVKTVASIAFKPLSCSVDATTGNAIVRYQVCTAPARGLAVEQPKNAVTCAPNTAPPAGKICAKPACDTEPVDSLNGWSSVQALSWTANMPTGATQAQQDNNGLGLLFYPPLTGGGTPSITSDATNMTAVKVTESFHNSETNKSAVGLRVAYRYKNVVTAEQMVSSAAVPDPGAESPQWATLQKLQADPMLPQLQQSYGSKASACLQSMNDHLAGDGTVTVCDPGYSNESGVRAGAISAQVATSAAACGTTQQCIREVVNTSTWTATCQADVPLSMRNCTTVTDHTLVDVNSSRTRTTEICRESRTVAEYGCTTSAVPQECRYESVISSGGLDLDNNSLDTEIVPLGWIDPLTREYRIGTVGDNNIDWGYFRRTFTINVRDVEHVKTFRIKRIHFDDEAALSMNGTWFWQDYGGGYYHPEVDTWGYDYQWCEEGSWQYGPNEWDSGTWVPGPCHTELQTYWQRGTSFVRQVDLDLKPYLKEGVNTLRFDLGVYDGGEMFFYLEISAYKPVCDAVAVTNACSTYEAAR